MTFLAFVFISNAQNSFKLSDKLPLYEKVIHGKLDNGLSYFVMENPEPQNRAYLRLVVNVGSAFEDEDQRGLAHFCEHMAFNGTKNYPKKELIEYLESLGMRFGADLNAYTSFDETAYMIEVPLDSAGFLDKGLLVLYDWASNVSYETEEIDNERGVIHEEWRLGKGANDRLRKQTLPVILYNSLYAERLPIGDTAIFDRCPPENLRRFYKDWYRPDLEAIIVVGDFDADLVSKKVIELFSQIPKRESVREHKYPEIPAHEQTLVKVATDKEAPYVSVSFYIKQITEAPETYDDLRFSYVQEIVSTLLGMRLTEIGNNSDAPFSYSYAFYYNFLSTTSMLNVFAVSKNDKVDVTVKTIEEELQKISRFGFTESELERAKNVLLADVKKGYNERAKISSENWVDWIHENYSIAKSPLLGKEKEYEFAKEVIPTISLVELNKAAVDMITDENKVVIVTAPEIELPSEDEILKIINDVKKSDLVAHEDVKLDKPLMNDNLKAGRVKKEEYNKELETTTWTLSNGIKVILKPTDFKDNQILLSAYSYGGYSLYPLEDNFSARFCTAVASSNGLGNYNQNEMLKFMADKNFSINPYVDMESEGFSGNSTKDDFETMLQMIYLYFTEPQFDDESYKIFIEKQKSVLQNQNNDPRSAWYDSISTALNNNSPYSKPLTMENLSLIDNKKAEKIFKERFADPASFTFVLVGSIDLETLKPLIEKYLGSLSGASKNEMYLDLGADYPTETKNVTARKGTDDKSMVYTVLTGNEDFTLKNMIALEALSYIMTDSLLDQIREKKAWTYSISANAQFSAIPKSQYGVFIFYSCSPERVDSINFEIMRIAENMKKFQITDQEMSNTIEKLERKHETDLRTNKYWLSKLTYMEKLNLGNDYITDFDKIAKELTKESIQEYAKKFFKGNYISIALKPEE